MSIVDIWKKKLELEKGRKLTYCAWCGGKGYYYFEPGRWRECELCHGLGTITIKEKSGV